MAEDNYVHKTLVIAIVFPCLATLAVVGRFVARRMKRLKLWWDDWTALLALVWLWCFCGLLIGSLAYGNGRHSDEVSPENQVKVKMFTFLYQLFYIMDPTTIKLSALLLYKRIFITEKFSIFINVMLALTVSWGIASILVSIFSCTPVSGFWTGEGHCVLWHSWVVGYAVVNIIFDFFVWLMPIPRIWMMRLPPLQKFALTVIFAIGLVDCIVAIVRIATVAQSLGESDSTYTWIPAQWWTLIHPTLGIITVCLPTMRIYLTRIRELISGCDGSQHPSASSSRCNKYLEKHPHRYPNSWPAQVRHKGLRELGISFSGDTDHNLHSNTIALALRQHSQQPAFANGHVKIISEFIAEHHPTPRQHSDSEGEGSDGYSTRSRSDIDHNVGTEKVADHT